MDRTRTTTFGTGRRTRRLGSTALAVVVLLMSVLSAAAAAAAECGCQQTGAYVAPARRVAAKTELSPGGGTYRLVVPNQAGQPTLQIVRASNGALIESLYLPLPRLDWGFSPDGQRLMYRHAFMDAEGASPQLDVVAVFDIAADRHVFATNTTAGTAFAFSPHGRWFQLNALLGTGRASILVKDAATAQTAYSEEIGFATGAGVPGDQFGSYGMGFSSDAGDRTFVRAYRQTNGDNTMVAKNLETGAQIAGGSVSDNAWWKFSPCGDVLGVVNQPDPVTQTVSLHTTAAPGLVGPTTSPRVEYDIVLESTSEHHRVLVFDKPSGPTALNVGPNTAAGPCAPAVALDQIAVSPAEIIGVNESTATISLNAPATAAFAVALSSSDPSAATVPSSVTVPAGSRAATFPVTGKAVTTNKSVTLTATANGVSRTATVVVKPSPATTVASLAVESTRPVGGGNNTTGTITLAGAAGSTGTIVGLTSTAPAAASVPASVTITSGQTSATFAITTAVVRGDTPVTITATSGGSTQHVRLTVLTADRQCAPAESDPATGRSSLRSFAAYDDAGTNANCGRTVMTATDITVGAGTTGLPVGTPVVLEATVQFAGSFHSSPPLGGGGPSAGAGGTSTFRIIDQSAPPREDDGLNEVATFRGDYSISQRWFDPDTTDTNTSKQARTYLWSNADELRDSYTNEPERADSAAMMAIDTGTLTARYATTVGAHLTIDAHLSSRAGAYGEGASAIADVTNVFQPAKGAPGFEGVTFTPYVETPEEPEVPETPPVNQAPTCSAGTATTPEDNALTGTVSCLDAEGAPLTYTVASGPAHGAISAIGADGSFTYTPAPDYSGPDSFTVIAGDGNTTSAPAAFALTVSPVNDAPVCTDPTGTTKPGKALALTLSCLDADGDPLRFKVVTAPANGTLSAISAKGEFTYTPNAGFTGSESFKVQASDGQAHTRSTFTIVVRKNVTAPPSKRNECKDDGWKLFNNPVFRNQAECLAFIKETV